LGICRVFKNHYLGFLKLFLHNQQKQPIMNKIKVLFSVSMLLLASVVFGQAEKTVADFKAGTKLTETEVGFLSMVSNADLSASRGAGPHSATVAGKAYSAGATLSATDAKAINASVKAFQKTYKAPAASRAGLCYYWYYYCSGGWCYWYKYWYYC
jgi:hypothetical protein